MQMQKHDLSFLSVVLAHFPYATHIHKQFIQAVLGIRGLGICGFDYLRTRKQGKTEKN